MRLVFDTDVVIAAVRSRSGASARLLRKALSKEFELLLSVPLALEYEAVLLRPEHRRVHGLSASDAEEVVNALISVAEPVQIRFLWRPVLVDPNDDMVLETAINGQADLLVTFNQHDFAEAKKRFALDVVRASEALRRVQTKR